MNKEIRPMPVAYVAFFQRLSEMSKSLGYALTLHGSMTRDLDLVAIPWVEDAVCIEAYVDNFIKCANGFLEERDFVAHKPHGRLGWAIRLTGGAYIDLSVMPRRFLKGDEPLEGENYYPTKQAGIDPRWVEGIR